jgi:hypothetical protein
MLTTYQKREVENAFSTIGDLQPNALTLVATAAWRDFSWKREYSRRKNWNPD